MSLLHVFVIAILLGWVDCRPTAQGENNAPPPPGVSRVQSIMDSLGQAVKAAVRIQVRFIQQ